MNRWAALLVFLAAPLAYGIGWMNGVNAEIDARNQAAQAMFDKRCTMENLYVSGTVGEWPEVFESITAGTFEPVLMDVRYPEADDISNLSPNASVHMPEVTLSFLEPEQTLVLRDPMLIERVRFLPIPSMAESVTRTNCIYSKFPELQRWIWSSSD